MRAFGQNPNPCGVAQLRLRMLGKGMIDYALGSIFGVGTGRLATDEASPERSSARADHPKSRHLPTEGEGLP
jgi:hypothetical protein